MSTQQHTRTAIATGTCLSFGLAVAVAMGAVPRPADTDPAAPVVNVIKPDPALSRLLLNPALVVLPHGKSAPAHRAAHGAHSRVASSAKSSATTQNNLVSNITVNPAGAAAAPAEAANIKQAVAHHKKHHHKKHHHHKKATTPATPKKAPRTTPSASAVSNAISGLRNYVHTPLTPTSAQVAQFGDAVCTSFDQNKTFSQVKAQILAQVQKLPFTTVSAGAADYVVKTAVSLYCPGYKSKVS